MFLLLTLIACLETTPEHSPVDDTWDGTCTAVEALPNNGAIFAIGDSMFDWIDNCGDAPDRVGVLVGERVENAAVGGATMLADIPGQYQSGPWEWVIVNGGGNDMECEELEECRQILGEVVEQTHALITEILDDGAKVVLVGYPNFRDDAEVAELWAAMGDEMVSEMASVASAYEAVTFVDLRPVMDGGTDPTLFDEDGLHPSSAGASVIARAIAEKIRGSR